MGLQILQDGSIRDTDTGLIVDSLVDREVISTPPVASPSIPKTQIGSSTSKTPISAPEKLETFNVIKLAKSRRRLLVREIKRLRAYENELKQLDRLLAAADKPLAIVHELKTNRK